MRKTIIRLSTLVVAVLLFATACEQERILFDTSLAIVGFSKSSLSVGEETAGDAIMIYLGATSGTAATTVSITVDNAGIANAAAEGTDFTLSASEVSVPVGEASFNFVPVDNDVFTGDRKCMLRITSNSAGYDIAAEDSIIITLVDNEHPLKNWLGTYDVAAASYGAPGAWDEAWTVITTPVVGELEQISMSGVGVPGTGPLIATLNSTAMTISIEAGQDIGATYYDYYVIEVYKGDGTLSIPDDSAPLTGTIAADGSTIMVDNWAMLITGPTYAGYVWDEFNCTFTKQ